MQPLLLSLVVTETGKTLLGTLVRVQLGAFRQSQEHVQTFDWHFIGGEMKIMAQVACIFIACKYFSEISIINQA